MEDLHKGEQLLYGNFLRLFDLEVQGNIEETGRLYGRLRDLDRSLFAGFVSFILARVGYYSKTILDVSGSKTTDNTNEDWIEDIELLIMAWAEELNDLKKTIGELADTPLLREHMAWNQYYENIEDRDVMKIVFVSRMPLGFLVAKSEEEWLVAGSIDPSCKNYIVVHPVTYSQAKEKHPDKLRELRNALSDENVSLLSTDEFVGRFAPDTERKHILLENWCAIRDTVLENLRKEFPIVVYASKIQQLMQTGERLKASRRECEACDLEHAIRDAGFACESLLSVLYYKEKGKEPENLTFNDLLISVKEVIETEFGPLVYSDLEFIRDWRNIVSHPQKTAYALDSKITLQVVSRSEIFYELFKHAFRPFQL